MTMWAQREGKTGVKISTTYGPIRNEVTEDVGHLRQFWGELGRLIEAVEAEQKAEATPPRVKDVPLPDDGNTYSQEM